MKRISLILPVLLLSVVTGIFTQPLNLTPGPGARFFVDVRTGEKVEKLGEYDHVSNIKPTNTMAVFQADSSGIKIWINAETGERVMQPFKITGPLAQVGSRYLFSAKDDNKWFFMDIDTREIIGGKFDGIGEMVELDGRNIIRVVNDSLIYFLDTDSGKILYGGVEESGMPEYYDNRYMVAVRKGSRWMWVDLDMAEPVGGDFQSVGDVQYFDGHYFFQAMENDRWFYVDLDNGERMPGEYESISFTAGEVDSGWAFRALKDMKWYIVRDWNRGMEGQGHDYIIVITSLGSDLVYEYQDNDQQYWSILAPDGNVYGQWTDMIDPIETGQGYFFKTTIDDGSRTLYSWVDAGNRKTLNSDGFYDLSALMLSPQGIIYRAKNAKGWAVFDLNGQITPCYEYIGENQIYYDGNTYFRASDGKDFFYIDLKSGKPVKAWGKWKEVCCFSAERGEFKVKTEEGLKTYSIAEKKIID